MNVLIVGLGLIGGSYAKGLKKVGYKIYGVDKSNKTLSYALENNIIDEGSTNPIDFINKVDLIILGLYPNLILPYLKEYGSYFTNNQIITDVCGTKSSFIYEVSKYIKNGEYISHHPMAGREKIGIEYADESIFNKANFLVTPLPSNTKNAIDVIMKIGHDLNFGKFFTMTPKYHDQMISFTSQLTHAIAVSLVNSDDNPDTKNYIGDSYRDLTRIAMINENLWSQLFLENKEFLIEKIDSFEKQLDILKQSLINNDEDTLKELFINSTKIRKEMEK